MAATREDLPEDTEALRAALLAERARAARVEAELAVARARASDDTALIAHQRLQIEKLTRQLYGQHSERTARLLDQMELTFEELESSAAEDEIAAERATAKTTNVVAFTRKRPARHSFPAHLPRERVVEPGPTACLCCGGLRRTSSRPSACTATTRSCRCWPWARPIPGGVGCTCATTGRSAAGTRRRRCSIIRAIVAVNIPRGIWPAMPGYSRPTLMAGTPSC